MTTARTGAPWPVYALGALCLGAIAAAILVVGPASGSQTTVTRTATVTRGIVQSTVSGSGNLQAANQATSIAAAVRPPPSRCTLRAAGRHVGRREITDKETHASYDLKHTQAIDDGSGRAHADARRACARRVRRLVSDHVDDGRCERERSRRARLQAVDGGRPRAVRHAGSL
jgi:hypothetical protein